jgi:ABC-type Fe3+/spermidine/putrescine transport system ATPase subunit
MTKLALTNLGKRFDDFQAVIGVDLALAPGEFVSLLGPSGCGKTTTLRMIAGFMPPSEGTIEMDGELLSSPRGSLPPERRRMSMIFQSYAIWPNMTVAENVAFGLKLRKLGRAEVEERVRRILGVVQLGALAGRYPAELSGGQQQRVALARAMVIEPEVLLLDEPLSNLDANLREEMRFEIRRLHDQFRITTVYVTHDQSEAMVTSDRIVVMNQGRIEQVDDPYSLYNRPKTRFVAGFIGRTNFLEGTHDKGEIGFAGFAVKAGLFPDAAALGRRVVFSVRPQSIRMARQRGGDAGWWLPGRVVKRAYLGEYWDYLVAPGSNGTQAASLRVSAPPQDVFEDDEAVWLEIDPQRVAYIPEES